MKIIWLSWKDIRHPKAGGAEVVSTELIKGLVKDGHEVILVTGQYPGSKDTDVADGYKTVRVGSSFSVYWQAYRYIKRNLLDWPDFVIEEINTIPFCSRLYLRHKPRLLFFHMLCREIWFYQLPIPASLIGYLIEPLYLRFLSSEKAIAMSQSTKNDLTRFGFKQQNITVISEGIQLEPMLELASCQKYDRPTIASLGNFRPMKRTMDQIRAFEIAKAKIPTLQMKIAGDGSGNYGKKVLDAIANSPYSKDIECLGRVSALSVEKYQLLQKAHIITVTSIKEGWGLIVTEAASQGTPAVVYNVDGLRDSVKDNITGVICSQNTPANMAANVIDLLSDEKRYQKLRENAWQWSKKINFENSYKQLSQEIKL